MYRPTIPNVQWVFSYYKSLPWWIKVASRKSGVSIWTRLHKILNVHVERKRQRKHKTEKYSPQRKRSLLKKRQQHRKKKKTLQEQHFPSSCSVRIEQLWEAKGEVQEETEGGEAFSKAWGVGWEPWNSQKPVPSWEESLVRLHWAMGLWLKRCHGEEWRKWQKLFVFPWTQSESTGWGY